MAKSNTKRVSFKALDEFLALMESNQHDAYVENIRYTVKGAKPAHQEVDRAESNYAELIVLGPTGRCAEVNFDAHGGLDFLALEDECGEGQPYQLRVFESPRTLFNFLMSGHGLLVSADFFETEEDYEDEDEDEE